MSDIEEEFEPDSVELFKEEHVEEEPVSSRRSSFVERTRRLKEENGVDDHNFPNSNGESSPLQSVAVEAEVLTAEVEDLALYDEVDGEWADRGHTSDKVVVALDEFVDIPEDPIRQESADNIAIPDTAAAEEIEVEEELEKAPATPRTDSKKTSFIETEVIDEVDTALDLNNDTGGYDEAIKPSDKIANSATVEKAPSKSVLAERAATKLQQADAAEAIALAAVKEKAERKAALNAAKRDRNDSAGGSGKKAVGSEERVNEAHQLGLFKMHQGEESEQDHQLPETQRSKGFLQRIRKSKAPTVPGSDSADERSVVVESTADTSAAGNNSGLGPKPPRRKLNGAAGRPGRRIASSTTEDGADSQSRPDREALRLPPLVHPRSSPDPSQLGDEDSMKVTENGDPSLKVRRHRKPLFLRMIERAQQQTLEDERQKNEQYAEQKKVRQRNNPTAEQLREHRLKHDEMMRAKQEESRRTMAEAAVVNARAAKKVSQVSGAEADAPTGDVIPLASDGAVSAAGASNNVKRKRKKIPDTAAAAGAASNYGRSADDESSGAAPISSHEKEGVTTSQHRSPSKNLLSPKKKKHVSSDQDRETKGGRTLFSGGGGEEEEDSPSQGHGSPVRNTAKRAQEGSKPFVARAVDLPDLTTVESVAAFCAPDWLLAFGRVDLDEVNNDVEANSNECSTYVHMLLQPPPPSLDAQNLMKRTV
eukprot:gene15911-18174_t